MMVLSGQTNQDAWATFNMGGFSNYTVTTLYSMGNHKYLVDVYTPTNAVNDLVLTVTATDNGTPVATTVREYVISFDPTVTGIVQSAQKEIAIFPNPAKEFISINHLNENSLITITDLSGRVVKQTRSLNTNQIISTSDLNDGVYMIAVQNNQQHVITKLIINK
jgi:hypothetical protein